MLSPCSAMKANKRHLGMAPSLALYGGEWWALCSDYFTTSHRFPDTHCMKYSQHMRKVGLQRQAGQDREQKIFCPWQKWSPVYLPTASQFVYVILYDPDDGISHGLRGTLFIGHIWIEHNLIFSLRTGASHVFKTQCFVSIIKPTICTCKT